MQTFAGEFVVLAQPGAVWRIDNRLASGESVTLRGVEPAAVPPGLITRLAIEWAPDGSARVTLSNGVDALALRVAGALLHEPLPDLYAPLALPSFTPDMARFWRRVFRIVRLPGGRWLIGVIARRARRGAARPQ
jgi:hypothetical protein